ncbi:MAG: exosortase/archaeosortase family protein [Candidatus Aenigmatarchaeota archaeon]
MDKKIQRKKKLEKWKQLGWFLLKSNLMAIPLYAIIFLDLSWIPLQNFIAYLTFVILKSMNYMVAVDGFSIFTAVGGELNRIDVSWDSTGWKSLYFLAALTLAVSYPLKKKLKFLAAGLPAIFLINLIRIVSTISYSLNYGFQNFEIVHTVLWREGLIFAVLGIWLVWLLRVKYNIKQTHIHI